jgi:hypothetical protein
MNSTSSSHDMLSRAKWDPAERLDLQAQLDAAFFLLYGIKRPDVEYILSTFSGIRKERKGSGFGFWCCLDLCHITNLTGRQVCICFNKRMVSDARTFSCILSTYR